MKAGSAPFHQWLPSIIEGLSPLALFILLTLQKINPLILISFISRSALFNKTLYLHIIASALFGSIGGLSQQRLRKILAFSSISHIAWLLTATALDNWVWSTYLIFYAIITLTIIHWIFSYSVYSLPQALSTPSQHLRLLAFSLISLGGLPPFTGFLPKLILIILILPSPLAPLLPILLASAIVTLFFYARLFIPSLLLRLPSTLLTIPSASSLLLITFHLSGLLAFPLIIIYILNFKLFLNYRPSKPL